MRRHLRLLSFGDIYHFRHRISGQGCDPDKPFADGRNGFSWNTMARIVYAIERYEQSLPADERGVIVGI